jgi:hypothetical protein
MALAALALVDGASAANNDVEARRRAERRVFSDAEIVDGFLKVAFGAEFRFGKQTDRIRKYDRPVRIYIENRGKPDRNRQVADIIADIRTRMKDLDIAVTADRSEANAVIRLVLDRDLAQTMRQLYGRENTRKLQRSDPQCLAGFTKDDSFRILHADVILVVDVGDFVFFDCAYEEILQALGPINDDGSVPWTMFNDDVSMGFFGVYDQLLMNILYDPRVRPGMTREEVQVLLPSILPDVRAFVGRTNNLPQ